MKTQVNLQLNEELSDALSRLVEVSGKTRPAIFLELLEIYAEPYEQLLNQQAELIEQHRRNLGKAPAVELSLPRPRRKVG
jgi:predicted DNA-binding protein